MIYGTGKKFQAAARHLTKSGDFSQTHRRGILLEITMFRQSAETWPPGQRVTVSARHRLTSTSAATHGTFWNF